MVGSALAGTCCSFDCTFVSALRPSWGNTLPIGAREVRSGGEGLYGSESINASVEESCLRIGPGIFAKHLAPTTIRVIIEWSFCSGANGDHFDASIKMG